MEKSLLNPEVRQSQEILLRLISNDFREIGTSGRCFGLAKVLNNLPKEQSWRCQSQDWNVRKISNDVVQVTYKALIKITSQDEGTYSSRSSIWRKEEDHWKLIFHQSTKVDAFLIKPLQTTTADR